MYIGFHIWPRSFELETAAPIHTPFSLKNMQESKTKNENELKKKSKIIYFSPILVHGLLASGSGWWLVWPRH